MSLKFYNTMTRRLEEFQPIEPGKAGMYTCGPTVYNYAHIGNYRAYVFEDILRRYLKWKGYAVRQIMNLTDVDDKTIKGSIAEKKNLSDYTLKYKKAFFEDCQSLNIERAEEYPEATKHIQEMVDLIKKLRNKGFTYESRGSIYFKISSYKNYGCLAHLNLEELKDGARIDSDEYEKEEARDFVLWKTWTEADGEVFWETELGKGRPGWHIECSAMSMKYLGESFDIHTGGVDNIFPHHENEIAQSEAATGKPFSRYWLHCAHLIVNGKKMSKSLGNFYTLRDLTDKGFDPLAIRYLLMSTHYRQPLNFTLEGITASEKTIKRVKDFVHNLKQISQEHPIRDKVKDEIDKFKKGFEEEMDDDLNISGALGKFFEMIKNLNPMVVNENISKTEAEFILNAIENTDKVLGILTEIKEPKENDLSSQLMELIIDIRKVVRKNKDWELADLIRDRLRELGIVLEDRPEKTTFKIL